MSSLGDLDSACPLPPLPFPPSSLHLVSDHIENIQTITKPSTSDLLLSHKPVSFCFPPLSFFFSSLSTHLSASFSLVDKAPEDQRDYKKDRGGRKRSGKFSPLSLILFCTCCLFLFFLLVLRLQQPLSS